jgi:predicted nucleotidyltransferase
MNFSNTFLPFQQQIDELCENHNVKSLYAFGSVLTSEFSAANDVDLIVEFNELDIKEYADNYFDLKFSLEEILKKPVDLLEDQAIKNPYFRQVLNETKELVYG